MLAVRLAWSTALDGTLCYGVNELAIDNEPPNRTSHPVIIKRHKSRHDHHRPFVLPYLFEVHSTGTFGLVYATTCYMEHLVRSLSLKRSCYCDSTERCFMFIF